MFDNAILPFLIDHATVAYGIVFFGMFVEGEVLLSIACGLAFHGVLAWDVMIGLAWLGTVIGDVLWWAIGWRCRKGIHQWVAGSSWICAVDTFIARRPVRTLMVAKFAYGLNRPTLVRIGSLCVPLRRFISGDMRAVTVWIVIVVGVNVCALSVLSLFAHAVRFTGVAIAIVVVGLIIFSVIETRRLNRQGALYGKAQEKRANGND